MQADHGTLSLFKVDPPHLSRHRLLSPPITTGGNGPSAGTPSQTAAAEGAEENYTGYGNGRGQVSGVTG